MSIKDTLQKDVKQALKSSDKLTTICLRLILAAIKQEEVDTRKEVSDESILSILNKMLKQRRESLKQFQTANRIDLADQEQSEIVIIQKYLPEPLPIEQVKVAIENTIKQTGAASIKDMGRVMAILKPQLIGKTDLAWVSQAVKNTLSN